MVIYKIFVVFLMEGKMVDKSNLKILHGLVKVSDIDASILTDMKYATADNFMKKELYPLDLAVLQLETAKKLKAANDKAKEHGLLLKIYDAYRPLSVQKAMWDLIHNSDFVANPATGSIHNRGAAVDVTIVDKDGKEILMPSTFDEFSDKARIDYMELPPEAIKNRELLASIMVSGGFQRMESEWWHFDDPDYAKYPVLDVRLEEFV